MFSVGLGARYSLACKHDQGRVPQVRAMTFREELILILKNWSTDSLEQFPQYVHNMFISSILLIARIDLPCFVYLFPEWRTAGPVCTLSKRLSSLTPPCRAGLQCSITLTARPCFPTPQHALSLSASLRVAVLHLRSCSICASNENPQLA